MINQSWLETSDVNIAQFMGDVFTLDQSTLDKLNDDYALRAKIMQATRNTTLNANTDPQAADRMQSALTNFFDYQFAVPASEKAGRFFGGLPADVASELMRGLFAQEDAHLDADIMGSMPRNGNEYVRWLRKQIHEHRVYSHPIYEPFLTEQATRENLKYFFAQETTLDPKFDDCLALMQVGTAGVTKMEIAHNYWDEMGNGKPEEVHTTLFKHLIDELEITPAYISETLSTLSKSSGNLSAGVCFEREHFYKAIGYFGVSEYLAPSRFKKILIGFKRLGFSDRANIYHDLHISVDTGHAQGWFNNVVAPLVTESEAAAKEITRGAFYRLNNSARYLDSALAHMTAMNDAK
ncbi:MAG: iron-containing redox enzyme family protein [Colwellia sp.]|nr:iron-containing redox enzyme family protein [Colwellia sp.]